MTSTQCSQVSRGANFHLISSNDDNSCADKSTVYDRPVSPIFKLKKTMPTSTISKPSTSTAASSSEVNKTVPKTNLVGYNDSVSDDSDIIDITGLSSDSDQHFKKPVSESELQSLGGKTFTALTDRKILWAKRLFSEWKKSCNKYNKRGVIRVDLDSDDVNKSELSAALCQFLSEVRRADGHDYPGNTLHSIVVMLQLHFEKKGMNLKLIDDPEFVKFKNTLDNLMKKQAVDRVSESKKAADPISIESEEQLWRQQILGSDDPDQLCDTVMFLVGLTFALRGGKEHHALHCPLFDPQIRILQTSEGRRYLEYREDPQSKSNQGGLKTHKFEPKVIRAYGHA